MRATPQSPRMFDNDLLDTLSRTPWWTVPLLWLPMGGGLVLAGVARLGAATGLGLALAGAFAWTLTEYWLHRTVFHWREDSRFHFYVHGVHHRWPDDPYRLVMPPAVSITLGLLFGLLFHAVLGPGRWMAFAGGFYLGYLVYDLTHYATHHLRGRNRVFLALKRHHLLHHFSPEHQDRRFGVSNTLWDRVFGTY